MLQSCPGKRVATAHLHSLPGAPRESQATDRVLQAPCFQAPGPCMKFHRANSSSHNLSRTPQSRGWSPNSKPRLLPTFPTQPSPSGRTLPEQGGLILLCPPHPTHLWTSTAWEPLPSSPFTGSPSTLNCHHKCYFLPEPRHDSPALCVNKHWAALQGLRAGARWPGTVWPVSTESPTRERSAFSP